MLYIPFNTDSDDFDFTDDKLDYLPTTSPSVEPFPRLAAAVPHVRAAMDAKHSARFKQHQDPNNRGINLAVMRADLETENAKTQAYEAIRSEMLPLIFGGEFKVGKAPSTDWEVWRQRPLNDHLKAFRRKGTRGPATFANSVIVAEPYIFHDGKINADAIVQAKWLRHRLRLGTWYRGDLSPWNPGDSRLILIAQELSVYEAETYGFTALA
jgi:hypothetical protein